MLDKTLREPRAPRWPIVAGFILVMLAAALIAIVPLMSAEVAPPPAFRVPDAPAPSKVQSQPAPHRPPTMKATKVIYRPRSL